MHYPLVAQIDQPMLPFVEGPGGFRQGPERRSTHYDSECLSLIARCQLSVVNTVQNMSGRGVGLRVLAGQGAPALPCARASPVLSRIRRFSPVKMRGTFPPPSRWTCSAMPLRVEGVDAVNLYHDFASGVRDDRPGLDSCSRALRKGDVLAV